MHFSSSAHVPPRAASLLTLLLLFFLFLCVTILCVAGDVPLSSRLSPLQIAPVLGFLEIPSQRGDDFVSFTAKEQELLRRDVFPALLETFSRGPRVLHFSDIFMPPNNAAVCREVNGSSLGISLYFAPLVGNNETNFLMCGAAIILFLNPLNLNETTTAEAAAALLSKALGIDNCPEKNAVLLKENFSSTICVGLRCAAGERVIVRQPSPSSSSSFSSSSSSSSSLEWTDCDDGLLRIKCPKYNDVCAAPVNSTNKTNSAFPAAAHVSARKPVKKRFLSAFGESNGLTHVVKEAAHSHFMDNTTTAKEENVTAAESKKEKRPPSRNDESFLDGSGTISLATSWALLVLLLVVDQMIAT